MKTGSEEQGGTASASSVEPPSPSPDSAEALIGTEIDARYRIDGIVGRGGMAVVYAGEHLELQRAVAIKVLDEAWASDRDAVERFLREARTASSLTHPHIVSVSDLGRLPDGRPFLVMPMIAGADLSTVLAREGPLPAWRVAQLLKGVAAALDLIHAKGLLHRDIKSENLMHVLNEDGTESVLVLDFGIAAACLSQMTEEPGGWCGTPEFMPPEALAGEPPDERGDVYALATVAFELIAGSLPFESVNLDDLILAKTRDEPRSMSIASGFEIDPKIEEVIAHGLSRYPDDRYASAGELIEALARASGAAPSGVQRALAPKRARRARTLMRAGGAVKPAEDIHDRETQPVTAGQGRRAPLESGTRAVSTRAERGNEPPHDPWLYTWSMPKPAAPTASDRSSVIPIVDEAPPAEPLLQGTRRSSRPSPSSVRPQAPEPSERPRPTWWQRTLGFALLLALFGVALLALIRVASAPDPRSMRERPAIARPRSPALPTIEPLPSSATTTAEPIAPQAPSGSRPTVPAASASPAVAQPASGSAAVLTIKPTPEATSVEASADAPPALPEMPVDRETARRALRVVREAGKAMAKGNDGAALAGYERATRMNPDSAAAWHGKGIALDRLGHTREAADAYREFLRLQPSGDEANAIRKRLWQLSPR